MTDRLTEISRILEAQQTELDVTPAGTFARILGIDTTARAIMALDGWRPIATAPKGGTRIWLYFPHKYEDDRQCVGWWVDDPQDGGYWMDHADSNITDPTHWQPLPSSPGAHDRRPDAAPAVKTSLSALELATVAVRDEVGSQLCAWVDGGSRRVCRADAGQSTCWCREVASAVLDAAPSPSATPTPSVDEVARAICCPDGKCRARDLFVLTGRRAECNLLNEVEEATAVLALFAKERS